MMLGIEIRDSIRGGIENHAFSYSFLLYFHSEDLSAVRYQFITF